MKIKSVFLLFLGILLSTTLLSQTQTTEPFENKENAPGFCFIRFPGGGLPEEGHRAYILKEILHAPADHELILEKQETDQLGYTHYRYKEKVRGLEVEDSYLFVHLFNHRIVMVNGAFFNIPPTTGKVFLSEARARRSLPAGYNQPGKLLYYRDSSTFLPAYKYTIQGAKEGIAPVSYYIDAGSGHLIKTYSEQRNSAVTSQVNTLYNGLVSITSDSSATGVFTLVDSTRGNGIEVRNLNTITGTSPSYALTDTSSAWLKHATDGSTDVMYALESTYDYFSTVHGRNSIDNAGMHLTGLINFGVPGFSYYTGSSFAFGLPSGTNQSFTAFDVVAHEYVHGVIAYSAALGNGYEPYALNESFADILAVSAEHYIKSGPVSFDIGEQCSSTQSPIRSMRIPELYNYANTYNGANYGLDVYSRASVQDYWFYLLCDGGNDTNDLGNVYNVEPIGIEKAANIVYRALTVYLGPSSGFAQSRTATIQAAIDLYGSCSPEEIAVTRAWYAVGVGAEYSSGVVAAAGFNHTSLCLGNTLICSDNCIGATSYQWTFGDGGTDTTASPTHLYSLPGNYTIQLIASGPAGCKTTDTIEYTVSIQSYNNTPSPLCTINRTLAGDTRGIYEVTIGNVTHRSKGTLFENYMDFTCEEPFVVHQWDNFNLRVVTGIQYNECVTAFIDYNQDGYFTNEEIISTNCVASPIKEQFITARPVIANTAYHMRVVSSDYILTMGCGNILHGQGEDHTIIFLPPDTVPVADFYADQTNIHAGSIVSFYSTGTNNYQSTWYFPGGNPAISTEVNPKVQYQTYGIYPVTLIASNAFGQDTMIRINYISVDSSFRICTNEKDIATLPSGVLYDQGGPNGNMENEICDFIIKPDCADSIFMWFTQFQIGPGTASNLKIFDCGPNGSEVLLFDGNTTSPPGPFVATLGKVRLRFNIAQSYNPPGFAMHWTTAQHSSLPVTADFNPDSYTPPLNSNVHMINLSSGDTIRHYWDFGDGSHSELGNAQHEYDYSGSFNIVYTAEGCYNSDTAVKTIVVQPEPQIQVSVDSINITIDCNDTASFPITIYNQGGGDLLYKLSAFSDMKDTIRALVYKNDADVGYLNSLLTVGNNFAAPFQYEDFVGTDTALFRQKLEGKNLLLFPVLTNNSNDPEYRNLIPITNDFLNRGGNINFYYQSNYNLHELVDNRPRVLGLMNATFNSKGFYYFVVTDTTPPLGKDLNNYVHYGSMHTSNAHVLNKHRHTYVSSPGYDILTTLKHGRGSSTIVTAPISTNPTTLDLYSTIYRNSLLMGRYRYPSYLNSDIEGDTIAIGDSSVIHYTINTSSIKSGTYETTIEIRNNSNQDSLKIVHLTVHVNGPAQVEFESSCPLIDTTAIGYQSSNFIKINNIGCGPLEIYGTSFNTPYFSAGTDTVTIPEGVNGDYKIYFQPDSSGHFEDTVIFHTNIGDIAHCVYGEGRIEAGIELSSSPVLTMNACGDSASGGFWIKNPGELPLFFDLRGGMDSLPRRVGIITYGVDTVNEYANIRNILQQSGLNVKLDTISSIADTLLMNFSADKDIVLIPKQETGSYTTYQYHNWSNYYIAHGGNILGFGTSIHNTTGQGMYICVLGPTFISGVDTANFSTGTIYNVNKSDYFTYNISDSFAAATLTYPVRLYSNNKMLSMYNKSILEVINYPTGNAYYLGFDFDQYNSEMVQVLTNIINKYNHQRFLPGFNVWPLSDTIAPGDSMYINFNLYFDHISQGTYPFNFIVHSTSPGTEEDSLTAYLNVLDNPCAAFRVNMDSSCFGIVQFTDRSINNPTSWLWDFGDGNTSTLQNPTHYYVNDGSKTVTLTVSSASGTNSSSQIVSTVDLINYQLTHTGSQLIGSPIHFTLNPPLNTVFWNFFWNFGDGYSYNSSFNQNNHSYNSAGTFYVSIVVQTPYCSYTWRDTVHISAVGLEEIAELAGLNILPNPFTNQTEIKYTLKKGASVTVSVSDIAGRHLETLLSSATMTAGDHSLFYKPDIPGVYLLKITINGITITKELIKTE